VPNGDRGGLSWNLDKLALCIGGAYRVWDGAALSSPSTGPVSGVSWVEYLAGRTIIGGDGTDRCACSDIGDPETFNGLNFATAEAREDSTVVGLVVGDVLYLLGERTTELWAPAGAGAQAFSRLSVLTDRGVKARDLACKAAGAVFFVGDDDVCYLLAGSDLTPVSPPWVINAIREGRPRTAIYWEERGHRFCAVTFSDRPACVCDLTTRHWWERAEGPGKLPWRARMTARLGSEWAICGDDGAVMLLRDVGTDAGGVLYREATSVPFAPGRWFRLAEVHLRLGSGDGPGRIGLQAGDGETFGPLRIADLPPVGRFGESVKFYGMGGYRFACLRVVQTDEADAPIFATALARVA